MGKPENSEKASPSVTLSITNPTRADPGANPGLRGDCGTATNRVNHGSVKHIM
jgi:hypothetical protein